MIFVRSLLFNIFFYLWTAFACTVMIPLLFTKPKTAAFAGKFWAGGLIFGCRFLAGIKYEIRGRENLPKEGSFIIASKHQSAWDTMIFLYLFSMTSYVLKKELLNVPLFGRFLRTMGMIAVDRSGGSNALKDMVANVKDRLANGQQVIIFPEGTRTKPDAETKYHPGIAFMYLDKDITEPVIPVALTSGHHWGRGKFIKTPGTIILEFLPEIKKGLDRKKFMAQLQKTIDERSIELARNG